RVLIGAVSLACCGLVYLASTPTVFVTAVLVAVLVPAPALALGQWRVRRAYDFAPSEWPVLASVPLHLVTIATAGIAAVVFRWMLPFLPTIVPLHWDGLGRDGYGSPGALWWSLPIVGFNSAVMLLAARMLAPATQRRLQLLRFVETLLTGFSVAVVILWLGVAASGRPGVQWLRPALLAAGGAVGLAALVALVRSVLGSRNAEVLERERESGSAAVD
ncbi:MAG: DUF1648 domain-containing protein, partial [Myxococcota bacterium]